MSRKSSLLSDVGIFLAGVAAAGLLTRPPRDHAAVPPPPPVDPGAQEWQSAIAALESRLAAQEAGNAVRFGELESRLEQQSAKLLEMPTTQQIVGAMEQLIQKTMSSLDERLTTQSQSIDILKSAVTQTDTLLERVLESLDSMQPVTESLDAV
jgi:uncharacterized coiled-coil protein SlyX